MTTAPATVVPQLTPSAPVVSPWTDRVPTPLRFVTRALATLWGNGKARIGLIILAVMILLALLAPVLAPYSP